MPLEYVRTGKSMYSPSCANSAIDFRELLEPGLVEPDRHPAELDVVAAGHLVVEADADREQPGDAAAHDDATLIGREDARDRAQQRRLPRAVAADDAEHGALRHVERDVAQGGHEPVGVTRPLEQIEQTRSPRRLEVDPIRRRDVLDLDREGSLCPRFLG